MVRCAAVASASVETRSGRIRGELRDGVVAFRGVPYAAPPVGPLRWRAPRRETPWAGERDATRPGPAAPQNAGFVAQLLGAREEHFSEDCLSLTVWTPACDAARRPVLVWIHGGGFTVGASSWSVWDGAELARRGDAVVVAINYRLGALGFLALPGADDAAHANFGLLDQIAALEWVREHAERFGGDPARITAFGNSAGAMSIAALLAAPAARGLFARAILQSGAARSAHAPAAAERVAATFAREIGAAPGDLDALRRAPVDAVLGAQARTQVALRGPMDALSFQPCVDGALLPRAPHEAVRKGDAPALPLLVGSNLEEWRFYGLYDPKAGALDDAALLRRVARILPGEHPGGASRAERAIAVYREARRARGEPVTPADLWFAIQTDRCFREPAEELAQHHRGEAWSYLFAWRTTALGGAPGACHSLEVPFVFGLASEAGRLVANGDPHAPALARRMQDAWLAFARDADPRTPELRDWRPFRPARTTQWLAAECRALDAHRESERAFWESGAAP